MSPIRAPQFPRNFSWLNTTEDLSLEKLKGHVVLLDFWTYCCINCIHILPDLSFLEEKYKDSPVMVVGVHSAKFSNEKDVENIKAAIERYEIKHPVVVDENHAIWEAYTVSAWPSFVLIDAEGYVRGFASGEGVRDRLDEGISQLLTEGKEKGILAKAPLDVVPKSEPKTRTLSFPGKILVDSQQRLFISDSNHNRIVVAKLHSPTEAHILDVIGTGEVGADDGDFAQASFNHPQGMCISGESVYICDTENHLLREINLKHRTVDTIAGTGSQALWGAQGGDARESALNSPWDVVCRGTELFIAMAGAHQIWRYDIAQETVEVFAGNGRENIVDETRLDAQLAQPSGVSLNGDRLYFADSEVSALRYVDLSTNRVQTIVGRGLFDFGHKDGVVAAARFQHCLGVEAREGLVFVADTYNHAVRVFDQKSQLISTIIGKEKEKNLCMLNGEGCDELPLFEPNDVALSGRHLYIADTNNHLIRMWDLETQELHTVEIKTP